MIQIKKYSPLTHKVNAVIYGASGSGKTTFAGTAKDAIFASAEGGLLSIASKLPNYVEIKSLDDLKEFYLYLKNQPHNYKTVIIDSITEINDIIKLGIEKKTGKPMQLQDWGTLSKEIKNILRSFRDLPMHCLFISQEVTDEKDENGTASKIVPSLNGKASTEIAYFMDIVGYIYVAKDGSHKIITSSNPRLLTKDRSGKIGNDTPPDFEEWIKRVATMETKDKEEVVDNFGNAPETGNPAPTAKETPKDIGNAVNQAKSPVNANLFDLAKGGLSKVTTLKQAEAGLVKVKAIKGLTDAERSELVDAYEAKVAQFS